MAYHPFSAPSHDLLSVLSASCSLVPRFSLRSSILSFSLLAETLPLPGKSSARRQRKGERTRRVLRDRGRPGVVGPFANSQEADRFLRFTPTREDCSFGFRSDRPDDIGPRTHRTPSAECGSSNRRRSPPRPQPQPHPCPLRIIWQRCLRDLKQRALQRRRKYAGAANRNHLSQMAFELATTRTSSFRQPTLSLLREHFPPFSTPLSTLSITPPADHCVFHTPRTRIQIHTYTRSHTTANVESNF